MLLSEQLSGEVMAVHVNLDALITRDDFEVKSVGTQAPIKTSVQINELALGEFFYGALRKPDFQRETAEWDANRVVGLIRSFIEEELIPAVILWHNRELVFVIDGSHRLSALIAWVHDDYGDGDISQKFFNYTIPDEQLKVAEKTRKLVEMEFGSYKSHRDAMLNPGSYGPDIVTRARRFASLSLQLQWVKGDAAKAEDSFKRINQRAVMITPQELQLITSRRKPNTIAARAIIRRGTGHQYWDSFAPDMQQSIKEVATDLHKMIFEPSLIYPIKNLDLPAGGAVYTATALPMIFEFISTCVGAPSPDDDTSGDRTHEYLVRCRRVMRLILSNHSSSLGLHPAVYFYSWTGKQQPILFLTVVALIIDFERGKRINNFIELRKDFEAFLIDNRTLLNQIVRKFGTKDSGRAQLRKFYDLILEMLDAGQSSDGIIDKLKANRTYSYLQPGELAYGGVAPTRYSTQVKSGLVMRDLIPLAPKCPICGGLVPTQAISIDHKKRVQDGGRATVDNAQLTHPYCNSGYKEWKASQVAIGEPQL